MLFLFPTYLAANTPGYWVVMLVDDMQSYSDLINSSLTKYCYQAKTVVQGSGSACL